MAEKIYYCKVCRKNNKSHWDLRIPSREKCKTEEEYIKAKKIYEKVLNQPKTKLEAGFINERFIDKNNLNKCPICNSNDLIQILMDQKDILTLTNYYKDYQNAQIIMDAFVKLSIEDIITYEEKMNNLRKTIERDREQLTKQVRVHDLDTDTWTTYNSQEEADAAFAKKKAETERRNAERNIVKCPRCSSTNIQMVPRKWSFWRGFATNAVDRVCVNCKHKF